MRARRIALAALFLATLVLTGTAANAGTWACAALDQADRGVCVSDPLPDELPLP